MKWFPLVLIMAACGCSGSGDATSDIQLVDTVTQDSRVDGMATDTLLADDQGTPDDLEIDLEPTWVPPLPDSPLELTVFAELPVPVEGLVFDGLGHLYLSSNDGRVLVVSAEGSVEEFAQLLAVDDPSEIGNAGITLGPDGALYVCRYGADRIERIPLDDPASITVFAEGIDGPNTVLFDHAGRMWFTSSGLDSEAGFVGRILEDGTVVRVIEPIVYANGLAVSSDGTTLYYSSSDPGSVHKVILDEAGNALSDELFSDSPQLMVADGLLPGPQGMLFVAAWGTGQIVALVAGEAVPVATTAGLAMGTATLAWGAGDGFSSTAIYATNLVQNKLFMVELDR